MTATLSPTVGRHGRALLSQGASPATIGIAAGLAAALIWSAFILFAQSGTSLGLLPQDFAALRFGTAALVMLPWLLRHDPLRLAGIGWRRAGVLSLLAGPPFILLATGGYAHAPLAHGAVIQPSTIALASMMAATVLLRERAGPAKLVGIGLILAGLAEIASHADAMGGGKVWIGDLMFVAAGLGWAGFTILIKRWELDPLAVTAAVSTLSALAILPVMLIAGDLGRIAALPPATLLAQVAVQGLAAGALAVIAYGVAVQRLGAAKAGLFPAIVPALTLALGSLASGTPPKLFEIAGALLATLGLVVAVALQRPAPVSPAARGAQP
ncbi:DMT family transporter [Erythrobacter sp. CCH5-A1]|jgi:drug/metabolite transporter (DMT)-like permease|uniref:DMT family transporter n=1 Tax=Erythrobacter sp. CCH5-A1 TaxID=1768792 RepID=UPI000832E0D7|nr:DMT family transporter [Erythrobacter sp. CCH5-A1]